MERKKEEKKEEIVVLTVDFWHWSIFNIIRLGTNDLLKKSNIINVKI